MESEQVTPVDLIKDVVRSSVKVPEWKVKLIQNYTTPDEDQKYGWKP